MRSEFFHLIQYCIDEGSFSRPRTANDEDIFTSRNSLTENVNVLMSSTTRFNVFVQRENSGSLFPNVERRIRDDRRNNALNTTAIAGSSPSTMG